MPSNKTNSTNKPATGDLQSLGDSVNTFTLIRRLVATPELRETGSGKSVTTIRVATHRNYRPVCIEGRLRNRE